MLREAFSKKTGINAKVAIINVVLVASAFLWYFYAFNVLRQIPTSEALLILGANFAGIAVSAIAGAALIARLKNRTPFLIYWMTIGTVLSFMPLVLDLTDTMVLTAVSAIIGGYFGLGMPACMGYYSAATSTENRARIGGITFLCIGLGVFLLSSIGISDIATNTFILAGLRGIGLIILLLLKIEEKPIEKSGKVSYTFVLTNKPFLLYLIPWCMFSLINYMAIPVISNFFGEEFAHQSTIIENVLIGVFAVASGFFADYFGRKRLAIAGFVMLGLGYAILGLFPRNMGGWYFYTFVDGLAWGIFFTIFLITLWGDLAQDHNSEKYYAIGALPYLVSNFMRLWLGSYIADVVEVYTVFSFAAFFLFLAVLPLVYAPETLPEKTMKDRELKNYIEKARKEVEKAQGKDGESTPIENEADGVEFVGEEFEEKMKEAEQYY